MKKVALVHWELPPTIGGVESHLVDLAQGLRSSGYEVFIVSGQRVPTHRLFPGVRLYYAPELDLNLICNLRGHHDQEPVLARVLNEIRPDIVHAHNLDHFDLGALALLTAMEGRYKYILCHTFHSLLGLAEAKELLKIWHVRLAVSDYVAKVVWRDLGFTTKVLKLPINTTRFAAKRPAFSQSRLTILHPTRIVPEKGVIRTLNLIRFLLDSGKDVELTLTSGVPAVDWDSRAPGYLAEVLGEVRRLKLERHVSFEGAPYAAMPYMYAKSDLVVYPSEFEEPLGLVPLEAMSSGRMIVASTGGGISESIIDGETGILFDHRDADDAFIVSVLTALNDRKKTEVIARKGRQRMVSDYALDQYIRTLIVAYNG